MRRSFRCRRGAAPRFAAVLVAALSLVGCADFTIMAAPPPPTAPPIALPPIGFNHRYGNNPLAAKDGFAMERANFAERVFWEVAIHTDPVQAGYVDLGKAAAVAKARRSVTNILLVIATEDRRTIVGLLAFGSNQGQQMYATTFLDELRALGYTSFTKAQVLIFFTESDEHAQLTWTVKAGYSFKVLDNNLAGTLISPSPGQTPLPPPTAPQ